MTIAKLIEQCEIRLEFLKASKFSYTQLAEYEMVTKIELEILEMEQTIATLKGNS